MKLKYLKLSCILLALAFGVGIFFTVRTIMTKHKVVNVHKVVNRETGEEITVYDDPELEQVIDDAIADLDVSEEELLDWMDDNLQWDTPSDFEDDVFIEDDLVIPDELEEETYEAKNPKSGTVVAEGTTERNISVSLDQVAYEDFMSGGGCTFPELTSDAASAAGFDSVDWELTKYYYHKLGTAYSRVLFNMDAMITDSYNGVDPKFDDKNDNQDYVNYINERYSYDNDKMQSFWNMMDAHYENQTIVWLNTGWKVLPRIQSWYGYSSVEPADAAPYDIKAFVQANIHLLEECERRYPDMEIYIAFGNEASNGSDFANDGDKYRYATALYTIMREALRSKQSTGSLTKVQLGCGEDADASYSTRDQSYLYTGGKLLDDGVIDSYSVHYYMSADMGVLPSRNYSQMYNRLGYLREITDGKTFINETGTIGYDEIEFFAAGPYYEGWWNNNTTAMMIAVANTGTRGFNRWSYGPAYWSHFSLLGEPDFSQSPGLKSLTGRWGLFGTRNTSDIGSQYYTTALLQNYIPAHSDVLTVNWEGEDIRVAAFKLSDGNYTFVVEANESDLAERKLTFKLDGTLGKKLYRISYSEIEEVNSNGYGLIPTADEWTKNVTGSTFTDSIDGTYCTYVYTTKKPVQQLKALEREVTLTAGGETTLYVEGVDVAGMTNKVEWEIVAASSGTASKEYDKFSTDKGNITKSGKYTASSTAKAGDRIAVKATATLADGSEIYTIILVKIE